MKPLAQWSPGRIFAFSYLPCLVISLLNFSQPHDSANRFILLLLGDIWYMSCYAVYMGTIAVTLSGRLNSDQHGTALEECLAFPVVYILLPILALSRQLSPGLLTSLSLERTLLLSIVSLLCFLGPAYSTAAYLTQAEQGRPTRFGEKVSTCLALSFFPFTVFLIQPRIKQVIQIKSTENASFE